MNIRQIVPLLGAVMASSADMGASKHRQQQSRRKSDLSPVAWAARKKRNKAARRSRRINRLRNR